jgi:hypothetical protein
MFFACSILDLCFRPDGSHIIVACGIRVLVYDSNDGNLLHSLKGHKEKPYLVSVMLAMERGLLQALRTRVSLYGVKLLKAC